MKHRFQQQFEQETKRLQQKPHFVLRNFKSLKPKMEQPGGKINWWWVIWNIGKIVAHIFHFENIVDEACKSK